MQNFNKGSSRIDKMLHETAALQNAATFRDIYIQILGTLKEHKDDMRAACAEHHGVAEVVRLLGRLQTCI